ncbi:piRNA biogenesis protein EXD1 [Spea bombifrons]|uniref:piRNA biogenesis protein EXD1 n=1 Tax=Spea bombifrons TaxID=233779 RepID=UPI00234BE562|nr:piRNA biogenesis protein EXD1 [Spea bombifrons]
MDTIVDYKFLSRVIGKTIKITMKTGCLRGVLINIDPSRTILISKVEDLETGKNIPGAQLLFGRDILNVELHKESMAALQGKPGLTVVKREDFPSKEAVFIGMQDVVPTKAYTSVSQQIYESALQAAKHSDPDKSPSCDMKMSFNRFKNLNPLAELAIGPLRRYRDIQQQKKVKNMSSQGVVINFLSTFFSVPVDEEEVEYTVIDQFQPIFGPAVRHLQNQKVLGIGAVGLNLCRHGKICWLQVASKSRAYLFDVLILGPKIFKNGLQVVLEDKSILKVIHDCRWLGDFLSHQYGVVLSNVFDTQVADVYLFSVGTGGFLPHRTSSLKECLTRYLNMPPSRVSFLTQRHTLEKDNPSIWFDRPLAPSLHKVLALEVMHLLTLRLAMLDSMLADYTLLVDGYLNSCRQGTEDDLASTELSCSELPKELQQLRVLQQVRSEKALKDYDVNNKGLLIRNAPEDIKHKCENLIDSNINY